ncbi:unnamed protein product, partial [Ixodes pacificus]
GDFSEGVDNRDLCIIVAWCILKGLNCNQISLVEVKSCHAFVYLPPKKVQTCNAMARNDTARKN